MVILSPCVLKYDAEKGCEHLHLPLTDVEFYNKDRLLKEFLKDRLESTLKVDFSPLIHRIQHAK